MTKTDGPEIHRCEQGSEEWRALRLGLPTASNFQKLMADSKEKKGRRTYLLQLLGEQMTGESMETYSNEHMEHGKEIEPELRARYAFEHGADIDLVGFIRDISLNAGCSPDGLIGDDGMVECKRALPHLLIEAIVADEVPSKYVAQCQGNLWIARRRWIDLVMGYIPQPAEGAPRRAMPLFVKRVHRDEEYIRLLARQVADFNIEMRHTLRQVKAIA